MELATSTQAIIIFSCMTSMMILGLVLQTFLINTSYYKSVYPYLRKTAPVTWTQMKDAFILIKKECIMTFLSVGLDYIPYPGIIFSIRPSTYFSVAQWNTFVSLSLGIADTLGKYLGRYKCFECLIKNSFYFQLILNLGIIVYYYTNIWMIKEMHWLTLMIFSLLIPQGPEDTLFFNYMIALINSASSNVYLGASK